MQLFALTTGFDVVIRGGGNYWISQLQMLIMMDRSL